MSQRLSRIEPLSAAKIAGVLYLLAGLLFVPFILVINTFAPSDSTIPGFGTGLAIVIPVAYAALGFVFTFIGAALYNLVAGWVGGLEVELN
jgi:hypothetical protein